MRKVTTTKPIIGSTVSAAVAALGLLALTLSPGIGAEKTPLQSDHWSFQKPIASEPPKVQQQDWVANAVDPFILSRIESAGLKPNPPAPPRQLIRRLSFDLTGLPPTPEQVAEFEQAFAKNPDKATEQLVDRLLASPHFGERWARLWMDVARYAEDQAHIVGKNASLFYPNAYLYRDWLIAAFNRDLPYNEFVRLQLAADKFESADKSDLVALGFSGLGPKYYRRNEPAVMADEWEDKVDTVTRAR